MEPQVLLLPMEYANGDSTANEVRPQQKEGDFPPLPAGAQS